MSIFNFIEMDNEDIVQKFENEKNVLLIKHDHCPQNPRNNDNLGKMVCFYNKYNLGDKHDFNIPQDFSKEITIKDNLILPLFLYDHSTLTISTTTFSCIFDSGQIGYIYISHEKIKKEYNIKEINDEWIEKITTYLKNEIDEYNQFLTGDVFGFEVYDKKGEFIDSCWGFYGDDLKENGMNDHIENFNTYKEV